MRSLASPRSRSITPLLGALTAALLSTPVLHAQTTVERTTRDAVSEGTRQSLTLRDAQELARRVSPALVSAREELATATALARQAGAVPNPVLSFQYEGTSGGSQDNSQNIVSVDQSLDLAVRGARRDAAERRRDAARARLQFAAAQLDLDVASAYASALATERRASLASAAVQTFANARRVSAERLLAGDISGYADRRIRLEAARYAALSAEATLASRDARLALAALLATDMTGIVDAGFELQMPESSTTSAPKADSLVSLALMQRADLRAAQWDADAAVAESRAASRSRIPMPTLTAGFKNERVTGVGELSGFVAGIMFPLPLWDRRRGAVDAAEAKARQLVAETEIVRRRVVREVYQAVASVESIDAQLRALAPELGEVASSALQSARIAYAEGEVSLVEWLDAVRAYHEAESAYASLQAESIIRHAALRRAVGTSPEGQLP